MSIVLAWVQSSGTSGHGKDTVQLCASCTVTNGCMCTVPFVLSRGKHDFLLLPTVRIEVFAIALAHFARAVGAGHDRRIILVPDDAEWHSSPTMVLAFGYPSGVCTTLLDLCCSGCRAPLAALGRRLSPIATSRRWMSCVEGASTTLCHPGDMIHVVHCQPISQDHYRKHGLLRQEASLW